MGAKPVMFSNFVLWSWLCYAFRPQSKNFLPTQAFCIRNWDHVNEPRKNKNTNENTERERDRKNMPIDNAKTCIDGKSYVNFKILQQMNECFNGKMMLLFFVLLSPSLSMSMSVCMKMMRGARVILVDILRSIHLNVCTTDHAVQKHIDNNV